MITYRMLAAALLWCISQVVQAVPDGYRLVKNWDFGVNIRSQWDLQNQFFTRYIYGGGTLDHNAGNNEWQRYRDNNNHVFSGGALSLTARIVGGMHNRGIESGMLRSKWAGQYGYFEARVKVPRGRGMFPAFWLTSRDAIWPPEIDIFEIVNNGTDTTRHSFHFLHGIGKGAINYSNNLNARGAYVPGFDYAAGFHRFAIEWTPTKVKHYVDGVLVVDRNYRWVHNNGSDGGPAEILINLAVGGAPSWPGDPQKLSDFPAKYEIDYIRVWQRP